MILDLFAGPRGWSEGLRHLGLSDVGLELDDAACRTAVAAGHLTIRCDVAAYPTRHMAHLATGLIASPPCTLFSAAGKGTGRRVLDLLADGIRKLLHGQDCRQEVRDAILPVALAGQEKTNARRRPEKKLTRGQTETAARMEAASAALVLEPARWIFDLLDAGDALDWICLEQVASVLPLWQTYAEELTARGWSAWAGVLNAADYGVPQTRRRAILIASRVRTATAPEPTHCAQPGHDLFSSSRAPWISMAEALGWDAGGIVVTRGNRRTSGGNAFSADGPSWALTEKTRSWVLRSRRDSDSWVASDGPRRNRTAGEPAPTFTGEAHRWRWLDERGNDSERVSIEEAAVIQSFRSDYPWQGCRTRQFLQAGNAVPPLLAAHVVSAATGIPLHDRTPVLAAVPA